MLLTSNLTKHCVRYIKQIRTKIVPNILFDSILSQHFHALFIKIVHFLAFLRFSYRKNIQRVDSCCRHHMSLKPYFEGFYYFMTIRQPYITITFENLNQCVFFFRESDRDSIPCVVIAQRIGEEIDFIR